MKNKTFLKTATKIYSWMKEEMKSVNNVMYTSIDADSEGKEGKFYVWKYEELKNLLNPKELEEIKNYYFLYNPYIYQIFSFVYLIYPIFTPARKPIPDLIGVIITSSFFKSLPTISLALIR